MNEFLEYPRRITLASPADSQIVVFTTAERIGGFFYVGSSAGAQSITFNGNTGTYFEFAIPQNSSGFVPARFFAFDGLKLSGSTANQVDIYLLIVDVGQGKFVDSLE